MGFRLTRQDVVVLLSRRLPIDLYALTRPFFFLFNSSDHPTTSTSSFNKSLEQRTTSKLIFSQLGRFIHFDCFSQWSLFLASFDRAQTLSVAKVTISSSSSFFFKTYSSIVVLRIRSVAGSNLYFSLYGSPFALSLSPKRVPPFGSSCTQLNVVNNSPPGG